MEGLAIAITLLVAVVVVGTILYVIKTKHGDEDPVDNVEDTADTPWEE